MKYTDPSGHSWFSKQWKKLKKWTKKNWRKIAGAVLIVAGAVATYYGFVIGISMMTTGASLIKYNPDEPASPTNEIRVDVGININFDFNGDFQNQYTQDNDQGKYIVNNVTQGTHSTTTGNKFSNGGDSATYNGTVGYDISYNPNTNGSIIVGTITVSNFNSGSDVLVVDGVKNERNIQKSFFDGVYSIGIALMRFGDYLAKISGFRDWQNGSVVMRNYYQNQAIRETKLTYRMAKYIVTNSIASSIFINSSYKYIMSNPKYFAGRVFAGPVLGFVARNPIWGTGSTVGDLSYTAESIDNLSRNLILGY